SEGYMHALPSWTSGTVCLFDGVERLVRQLVGLRRKLGQAGREIIDHAKSLHAHDDLAVCVCGVIYQATPIEFNTIDIASLEGIECWGDDVPEGKVTSFPMAVKRKDDETVVFSWIIWPSRNVRDEAMKKVMADPRLKPDVNPMPFDGKRLIYGGFEMIVEA